jgi:hypothetical protein
MTKICSRTELESRKLDDAIWVKLKNMENKYKKVNGIFQGVGPIIIHDVIISKQAQLSAKKSCISCNTPIGAPGNYLRQMNCKENHWYCSNCNNSDDCLLCQPFSDEDSESSKALGSLTPDEVELAQGQLKLTQDEVELAQDQFKKTQDEVLRLSRKPPNYNATLKPGDVIYYLNPCHMLINDGRQGTILSIKLLQSNPNIKIEVRTDRHDTLNEMYLVCKVIDGQRL